MNWALRFLRHDHRSGKYLAAMGHIANTQIDETAATQLAVNRKVDLYPGRGSGGRSAEEYGSPRYPSALVAASGEPVYPCSMARGVG